MASYQIRPDQVPAAIRQNIAPAVIRRGLVRAAYRGQALLRKRTPTDQGMLKNSWAVREWGNSLEVQNSAPYAGIIEAGARPHPVSLAGQMAIYWWVVRHRKFFASLRTSKGNASRLRHKRAQGPVTPSGMSPMAKLDSRVASIVFAITKRIRKKGQRPTYFVRDSLPELNGYVEQEVGRAIRERSGAVGK